MLALASQQLPSQSTPPHDTTVPKKPGAVHPTSSPKACSQSGARQYFQQQPSVPKHLSRVWSPTRMQSPGLGDFATTKWAMQMSHSKDQMSQARCGSCPIPPGAKTPSSPLCCPCSWPAMETTAAHTFLCSSNNQLKTKDFSLLPVQNAQQ